MKRRNHRLFKSLALCAIALGALTACGGSGGSNSTISQSSSIVNTAGDDSTSNSSIQSIHNCL